MSGIDPNDFIEELLFCLKEKDIVKAKALLQFASDSEIDPEVQTRALMELGRAPEDLVFPLLEQLTRVEIKNPEFQDALYELILDKAFGNSELVISYITQGDKENQIIYLRAAGDLILTEAAPALLNLLSTETDSEILLQTARSLGAMRLPEALPALGTLTDHPDLKLQHGAIFAMADVGGREAIDQIKAVITGTRESDLIAVEALAEIQDQYALDTLASLLESRHTHIRDAAIDQLIEIGNKAVPILTSAIANAQADYMVHLLTTLGYIGDQAALPTILDIINLKPRDPNIRQAAYEALDRLPSTKSAISLAGGLQDEVEAVRMSAARAVDKNISKVLVAGLKNIVREENQDALHAVSALMDSGVDGIFNFLLEEESFLNLATTHLVSKASPEVRNNFLSLLKDKGKQELAQTMGAAVKKKSAKISPKSYEIFVVDDSKMMLKLYQNKLTAMGYSPTLFQFPEEVLPAVAVSKPDLIITDLNMPKINGIQLTLEIRKKYSRQELPIIMITTQSDFVEATGCCRCKAAGMQTYSCTSNARQRSRCSTL
ncbi:MAG: hypothetical protein B6230_07070 [Desulfobacteraceae bacterium 4572_89]|nr:MAG: hypothetical protein B6230_07070 [Desulfobacteraceae bacterium 4572_89]